MDLYEELNQLIVKNGVRNTSGPTYTPLDPAGHQVDFRKNRNDEVAELLSGNRGDGYGRRSVPERAALHSRRRAQQAVCRYQ